jgi:transcriptional regulator with XRE-family HTH domain
MEIFVNRLNQLLKESNITRYRLAKELDVNKQTVTFWADGINEPKASYIAQIAAFFDVSADYLLGLENENGSKVNNYHFKYKDKETRIIQTEKK